jgi:hypothetical protein
MSDLLQQLEDLKADWATNSRELMALNGELGPLQSRRYRLIDAIKRTHRHRMQFDQYEREFPVVTGYRRAGAVERFGLFADLNEIDVDLGPLKVAQRELMRLDKFYRTTSEDIRKAMEQQTKQQRRTRT